ncbi:MAG: pyridoxamine 5'-phosphate oxidase family protein, partial [Holdemania filiformis]
PLKKDEAGQTIYSYREMYQIATSYNNEPGLSSVEFVLDPQTMKLYASSEKGTEKCVHIAKNPKVVLYWYKQIPEEEYIAYKNDYFNSYGVQIKGTAKLMDPASEEAQKAAALYLETLYGAEGWAAMGEKQPAIITKLLEVNDWIEIDPTEYVVNSLQWSYNKEGSTRPEWYDPESPYFGKSVRQVYYVH